jgi:DNA (cytosine-5)-methyltransferase 1
MNKFIKIETKWYLVISLFSGMCGMDLGFAGSVIVRRESIVKDMVEDMVECDHDIDGFVRLKRLPFEVVFQNDILPVAKSIAEWNHWDCPVYALKDIRLLLTSPAFHLPIVDVVIGGFPCQDFSHAGKRKGLTTEREATSIIPL